ncbi:MAG: N-ethylmaleimide reductase (EC, partial [uncultured Sphingomonadaceae bacterium]
AQPVRSDPAWCPTPAQSRPHGPAHPRPRDPRTRADRAHGDLLRPARVGRADHQRSHWHQPGRARLALRPRAVDRRAGGGLETGRRRGEAGRRAHRRAAVAHGPRGAFELQRRPPARLGQRDASPAQGAHLRGPPALRRRAPAGRGGAAPPARGLRPRRAQCDDGGVRRGAGARGQRLPDRPISAERLQPPGRRLRRLRREPRAAAARGRGDGRGRGRRGPHGRPAVAQRREPGRRRQRSRAAVHRSGGRAGRNRRFLARAARAGAGRNVRRVGRAQGEPAYPRSVPRAPGAQQRLHGGGCASRARRGRGGRDQLRPAVHRQPGPGAAAARGAAAGAGGPKAVVQSRRGGVRRLSRGGL